MTAAFSQGQLQDCEARCAAMGTQGCSSEQGPFAPSSLCAGAGTLLPARVCTQPAQEIRTALQGEAVGRRSNPQQGRARSLCCREGAA